MTFLALRGLLIAGGGSGMTQVTDLSALQGMSLERLDLENVPVTDLRVLSGMPLKVLKMQKSKVTDFAVLGGLRLEQLKRAGPAICGRRFAVPAGCTTGDDLAGGEQR
ncbi:MAG UNVERIFIED_CONTAM: hypothetical protein LVR18_46420 [Planctomycetaceae bacterium]